MAIMKSDKISTEYIKPTCFYLECNIKSVIATSNGYTNDSLDSESDDFLI